MAGMDGDQGLMVPDSDYWQIEAACLIFFLQGYFPFAILHHRILQ